MDSQGGAWSWLRLELLKDTFELLDRHFLLSAGVACASVNNPAVSDRECHAVASQFACRLVLAREKENDLLAGSDSDSMLALSGLNISLGAELCEIARLEAPLPSLKHLERKLAVFCGRERTDLARFDDEDTI